jgi:hypothetical protein
MPVSMSGSPPQLGGSPTKELTSYQKLLQETAAAEAAEAAEAGTAGAAQAKPLSPDPVEGMRFPAAYTQVLQGSADFEPRPQNSRQPHHIERFHYAQKWHHDLKDETELGLAPPNWSVSSKMDDTRPNGKSLFDARFVGSPMGRARGGYSIVADARGIAATKGMTAKAVNMDSNFFAEDMSDETAAAKESAERNQFGNTNLAGFEDAQVMTD